MRSQPTQPSSSWIQMLCTIHSPAKVWSASMGAASLTSVSSRYTRNEKSDCVVETDAEAVEKVDPNAARESQGTMESL